jgi:hypothetical protein
MIIALILLSLGGFTVELTCDQQDMLAGRYGKGAITAMKIEVNNFDLPLKTPTRVQLI